MLTSDQTELATFCIYSGRRSASWPFGSESRTRRPTVKPDQRLSAYRSSYAAGVRIFSEGSCFKADHPPQNPAQQPRQRRRCFSNTSGVISSQNGDDGSRGNSEKTEGSATRTSQPIRIPLKNSAAGCNIPSRPRRSAVKRLAAS